MPPTFKAAYLVHGDDHARIAERRARLRALAEQQGGASGAELFEGDEATLFDVTKGENDQGIACKPAP